MRQVILGVVMLSVVVLLAILMAGGRPTTWLHPFTFWMCFTVGVPVIALHTVWSRRELRRALAHATQTGNDLSGAPESISVWKAAEGIAYVSGILGCVTGLMITFTFMDKGGLGFKIAASLTPVFFGLISAICFRLLRLRVEHQQAVMGV